MAVAALAPSPDPWNLRYGAVTVSNTDATWVWKIGEKTRRQVAQNDRFLNIFRQK